jgi:hypothetical protein
LPSLKTSNALHCFRRYGAKSQVPVAVTFFAWGEGWLCSLPSDGSALPSIREPINVLAPSLGAASLDRVGFGGVLDPATTLV